MDIDETLKFIDQEYLSHFDARNVYSAVKTQSPLPKRKIVEAPFGISENESLEKKTIHALYIALNDHITTEESLAFKILSYVLVDMDGAPLKKAVLDAGIGNDVSSAYGDSYKQPVWTIEVTGSEIDKREKFISTVDRSLLRHTGKNNPPSREALLPQPSNAHSFLPCSTSFPARKRIFLDCTMENVFLKIKSHETINAGMPHIYLLVSL